MIEVSLINVYTGDTHFEYIQKEMAFNTIDDINLFASKCVPRYKLNPSIRLSIYAEIEEDISKLLIHFKTATDIDISRIEYVLIECTIDMCPIVQTLLYKGNSIRHVHDFYEDAFKLSIGDIVFNYRDGKFYYIKDDPSIYALRDIMWNDDIPSCDMSKFDLRKATEHDLKYFNLDKLMLLRNAKTNDEYQHILNIITKYPRLIN